MLTLHQDGPQELQHEIELFFFPTLLHLKGVDLIGLLGANISILPQAMLILANTHIMTDHTKGQPQWLIPLPLTQRQRNIAFTASA